MTQSINDLAGGPRECMTLDGAWRFQLDPFNAGEIAGYAREECDTAGWRTVTLPAGFDECGPGLATYQGFGWFHRTFTVPAGWADRRIILQFGAVNFQATIWLNGHLLGEHADAFLPFAFSVDHLLRYDTENILVLRVDGAPHPGEVPGPEHGWRPIGGILREVTLLATEYAHLDYVHIIADADGAFQVQATVVNQQATEINADVCLRLRDAEGIILAQSSAQSVVPVHGEMSFVLTGVAAEAVPWHPDHPVIYTARLELRVDGQLLDAVETPCGFRRIEVRDGQLLLNGQPLVLRGFNRHEDSPETGMRVDLKTAQADFLAMKAIGANFVRLCHYPHHPGELALCDALGLLVMCEIPLYWWIGLDEGEAQYTHKIAAAQRQLATLIERDYNHPSVIFWSVSNETREQRPGVVEGNDTLIEHAKKLDLTRLVVHVADESVWISSPHFLLDDVICINGYPSWFKGMEAGNPHYDLAESTRFWQEHLARLHSAYPGKPIFITEFGYPSQAGLIDGPLGEDTQARVLEAEFAGMAAPGVCGTLIWCFADHLWPENVGIRNLTTSPFGVVSREREPLLAYERVRIMFSSREPIS